MKTGIIFLAFLFVCAACTENKPKKYNTIVMIDQTEVDGYRPASEELRAHANCGHVDDGKSFSLLYINDRAHNTRRGAMISPAEPGLGYDPVSRKKLVDVYERNVEFLLKELDSMQFGADHSNIFRAVLSEARFLMKQECDVRTIVCYSDLQENSQMFSVQSYQHRKLMKDPLALARHFESHYHVEEDESFEGLEIHIYHLPSYDNEEYFDVFLKVYRHIFERRGATVIHEVAIITKSQS